MVVMLMKNQTVHVKPASNSNPNNIMNINTNMFTTNIPIDIMNTNITTDIMSRNNISKNPRKITIVVNQSVPQKIIKATLLMEQKFILKLKKRQRK